MGACNSYALAISLGEALAETGISAVKTVEYKYVLGHLSFLAGEALGPSQDVVQEFERSLTAEIAAERVEQKEAA